MQCGLVLILGKDHTMKHFNRAAAAIMSIFAFTACSASNINSGSAMESTTDKSQSSYEESAPDNTAEVFTSAEEAAESFIRSYYDCVYSDNWFEAGEYAAYEKLGEYLSKRMSYQQEAGYDPAIEAMEIDLTLEEKEETDGKVYLVYFAEATYNRKGEDFQSGFGDTVQIIIDNESMAVCDFYTANNSIDIRLRGEGSELDPEEIIWEDDQASETLISGLEEIIKSE